ncbi:MAG: Hpt domain-containing protein [Sulfitobacter sp.]|nr:Hpt domain-containing protein [Sulfitobacter sp.]
MTSELPGIARVRARFLDMLAPRQEKIAAHAVAAWDGQSHEDIAGNLVAAQSILHQIAGTAGSLGYAELGKKAQACERSIIDHLNSVEEEMRECPGNLIQAIDQFIQDCRQIITQS